VTADSGLFIIWITFTVAALIGLCAILVWAVRSRQFSNQDDARYLPLRSGVPEKPDGKCEENDRVPH
jgi:hypothetical protein